MSKLTKKSAHRPRLNSTKKSILDLLNRIEATLLEENAVLERNETLDLRDFIADKSRFLRELSILIFNTDVQQIVRDEAKRFAEVRKLIDRNYLLIHSYVPREKINGPDASFNCSENI